VFDGGVAELCSATSCRATSDAQNCFTGDARGIDDFGSAMDGRGIIQREIPEEIAVCRGDCGHAGCVSEIDSNESMKVSLDRIRLSFQVDEDNRQELQALTAAQGRRRSIEARCERSVETIKDPASGKRPS